MAESPKRQRLDGTSNGHSMQERPVIFPPASLTPATTDDKKNWNGFCEIESEPAFFNVILKELGVRGVKVQEVVSLESEMLELLPRPVYGLIFLFRWKEDDPDKQESSCPEGLWFANQTVSNACASVALLNIVNNIPEIDLGEPLRQFRHYTEKFTPALRGDAIGNFHFVKQVHNSFARKMDMLNGDLQLKNEAMAKKQRLKRSLNNDVDDSEAGFHFIAFVPLGGQVWKLDGLERQPQCLGNFHGEDWVTHAKPVIEARMAEYEEGQIEFGVLSLVKDPLLGLVPTLAENVKVSAEISSRLQKYESGWEDSISVSLHGPFSRHESTLTGPDEGYALTADAIEEAVVSEVIQERLDRGSFEDLRSCWDELVAAQARVRSSIKEEQQLHRSDADRAASRRHDYGPIVHTWVRMLAQRRMLQPLLEGLTTK